MGEVFHLKNICSKVEIFLKTYDNNFAKERGLRNDNNFAKEHVLTWRGPEAGTEHVGLY